MRTKEKAEVVSAAAAAVVVPIGARIARSNVLLPLRWWRKNSKQVLSRKAAMLTKGGKFRLARVAMRIWTLKVVSDAAVAAVADAAIVVTVRRVLLKRQLLRPAKRI